MSDQKLENPISRDFVISELIMQYPEVAEPLMKMGIHCVGCHVSVVETLGQGLAGHGMTDEQIDRAIQELNEVVNNTQDEPANETKGTLKITDLAAEKIKEMGDKAKKTALRIGVVPGGCSGFQYDMEFTDKISENDIVVEDKGVKVVVDKASMDHLRGSEVNYIESLQGAGFSIQNPNAESTCGCGSSFS